MQNNLIPIYDDGAKSVSPEAATMKKIVGILSGCPFGGSVGTNSHAYG